MCACLDAKANKLPEDQFKRMTSAALNGKEIEAAQNVKLGCPLKHHIQQFTAVDGNTLTTNTMTNGHSAQGITDGVYVKCWAIQNLLTDRNLPHTSDSLLTVNNPARSGLWTADGKFDEKVYAEVCKLAIDDSKGQKVLTRKILMNYLADKHKGKTLGTATKLGYMVPVSWTAVTEGSIKELFLYYSDSEVKDTETGKMVQAMTVEQLKLFYAEPEKVIKKRMNNLHKSKFNTGNANQAETLE